MNLSPYKESSDALGESCHMLEPKSSHPQQRQPLKKRRLSVKEKSHPQFKKRKHSPCTGSQPPAAFWDNLSKLWLTKLALREFDRRNAAPSLPNLSFRQYHRPVTRGARAQLQKRRTPTQTISDFLCHCGSKGLKDLKLFARRGGPDLSDLPGYPEPIDPLQHLWSLSQAVLPRRKRRRASMAFQNPGPYVLIPKTTSPYDQAFQQNLIDGGVFPAFHDFSDGRPSTKPDNWEEIKRRLAEPRPDLSEATFSDEAHQKFVRTDAYAASDMQVITSVIPIIEGEIEDPRCASAGILFNNLAHLTDHSLVFGKPDRYYGARPEHLNRQVRNELASFIIPSADDNLPLAPNLFLTARGHSDPPMVCGREACYLGALGARGLQRLQLYGQGRLAYDRNAYTITAIYLGGQLKLYTVHPGEPRYPGGRPEYIMNQLDTFGMTGNPRTFREGATCFRNARDWAKEKRNDAIAQANLRAGMMQLPPLNPVAMNFNNWAPGM